MKLTGKKIAVIAFKVYVVLCLLGFGAMLVVRNAKTMAHTASPQKPQNQTQNDNSSDDVAAWMSTVAAALAAL